MTMLIEKSWKDGGLYYVSEFILIKVSKIKSYTTVKSANLAAHCTLPMGRSPNQARNIPKGPPQGPRQFKPTHLKPLVPQCLRSSLQANKAWMTPKQEVVRRSYAALRLQTQRRWTRAGQFCQLQGSEAHRGL